MEQEAALVVATNAVDVFVNGGLDATLREIEQRARSVELDISTEAGRKLVASTAYKVARSKTALDDLGKALVADTKKQIAVIDAERRRAREYLEALQADIRAPLTEYEEREKARCAAHEAVIHEIGQLGFPLSGDVVTAATMRDRIARLAVLMGRDWQEFAQRAECVRATTERNLGIRLAECEKREAEQAELTRLRAEADARAQAEREQRIAQEAADKARREAEAKAEAERRVAEAKAKAEREVAERNARLEREAAESAARRAAAEAAEKVRAAEAKAEAERRAAEKAKRDAEAAVERERARAKAQADAEAAATAKREANTKHRAQVRLNVEEALAALGAGDDSACAIFDAIDAGDIPHVKVVY